MKGTNLEWARAPLRDAFEHANSLWEPFHDIPTQQHHPLLQCGLLGLYYDASTKRLEMFLPAYECTDMSGAIALARAIAWDVVRIDTYAGDKPDTRYVLADGDWKAVWLERS